MRKLAITFSPASLTLINGQTEHVVANPSSNLAAILVNKIALCAYLPPRYLS